MIQRNIGNAADVQIKKIVAEQQFFADRYDWCTLSTQSHIHRPKVGDDIDTRFCSDCCAVAKLAGKAFIGNMKSGMTMRSDQLYLVLNIIFLDEFVDKLATIFS